MNYGLSQEEFEFLKMNLIDLIKLHQADVYLFGSRAKGKFQKFSDIDLFYKDSSKEKVPSELITKILIFFEDSHFPYKIDLVKYESLAKSYLPGIEQDKIKL